MERLAPKHVDQVLVLVALNFSEWEPMSHATKVPPTEFFSFAKAYATKSAEEGMGAVAVDKCGYVHDHFVIFNIF